MGSPDLLLLALTRPVRVLALCAATTHIADAAKAMAASAAPSSFSESKLVVRAACADTPVRCATHAVLRCTQVALATIAALSVVFFWCGPLLSRLTKLPIITIYLAGGLLCQLFISPGVHKPLHDYLQPMHNAALGCITLAAGGELVLEQLRANARAIGCITFSLSVWSLLLVFPLTLSSLMRWELLGTGSHCSLAKSRQGITRPGPRPTSQPLPYRTERCWPAP